MKKIKNIPSLDAIYEVFSLVSPRCHEVFMKLLTFFLILGKLTPDNFLQIVTQCDFSRTIYRIEHCPREKERKNALEEYESLIYDQIDTYQYALGKFCELKPRGKNKAEQQKIIEIFKEIKEQIHIDIPMENL